MKRLRSPATTARYIDRLLRAIEQLHYMCNHPGAADDILDKIPPVLRRRLTVERGRHASVTSDLR